MTSLYRTLYDPCIPKAEIKKCLGNTVQIQNLIKIHCVAAVIKYVGGYTQTSLRTHLMHFIIPTNSIIRTIK
jgi:hypothetical protein